MNKKNAGLLKCIVVFSLQLLVFSNSTLQGQSLTADEVMQKHRALFQIKDQVVDLKLTLINSKQQERQRTITWIYQRDKDDNYSSFISFKSPADVKGTSFMSIEYTNKPENQWLYMPSIKKVRRISESKQSDRFMGTDFTYEDIGMDFEHLEHYKFKMIGKEKVDNHECYVIESVPGDEKTIKESGYSKRVYYIKKDLYLAAKITFFNSEGQLVKTFTEPEFINIENANIRRGTKIIMEDHTTNHKTVLDFSNYRIDKGLKENTFTLRNLEAENL